MIYLITVVLFFIAIGFAGLFQELYDMFYETEVCKRLEQWFRWRRYNRLDDLNRQQRHRKTYITAGKKPAQVALYRLAEKRMMNTVLMIARKWRIVK